MVNGHSQPFVVRALLAGLVLSVIPACSSFHPVEQTRYTLLNEQSYGTFGMRDAHWVAYDDQHSRFSACTNGAAGNHHPRECSHLDRPVFDWDGGKCPPSHDDLAQGEALVKTSHGICIQGELSAYVPCTNPPNQCSNSNSNKRDFDGSNMWGAGVGLTFSRLGDQPWNPQENAVKGVAFDLILFPEDTKLGGSELNLRVQVPSILLKKDVDVEYDQPLMTDEGAVIGPNGDGTASRHGCDSKIRDANFPITLADVSSTGTVTSEQHPYGSSYWQLPTNDDDRDWGPSPVEPGHNQFEWNQVAHPPGREKNYEFDDTNVLGIHFQVAHPKIPNFTAYPFSFCIDNLAFLTE